jgi:hypothetical protein
LSAVVPTEVPLTDGTWAEAGASKGIEVFPKAERLAAEGLGHLVWLPWWCDAAPGGNQFYAVEGGAVEPYLPAALDTNAEDQLQDALRQLPPDRANAAASHPGWFAQTAPAPGGRVPASLLLQKYLARASGRRNQAGFDLACRLRDNDYSETEAHAVLLEYQRQAPAGDHAYTIREALQSLTSAYRRPPRDSWRPPPHDDPTHPSLRQPDTAAEPDPGGPVAAPRFAKDIILAHFRTQLRPVFRRGEAIYSVTRGREVKRAEACFGADSQLVRALATAVDCPKVEHDAGQQRPKLAAIPKLFATWSRTAWADLIAALPDEEAGAEVTEPAREEFRALVAAALHRMATLAHTRRQGHDEVTKIEHRSLIDWAVLFAKPGRWAKVRSYCLWTRRATADGPLRVAVAVPLFAGQGGAGPLAKLTQRKFAQLAELYGVGTGQECRAGGARCVELAPEFLAELLDQPPWTEASPNPVPAHARDHDPVASTGAEAPPSPGVRVDGRLDGCMDARPNGSSSVKSELTEDWTEGVPSSLPSTRAST